MSFRTEDEMSSRFLEALVPKIERLGAWYLREIDSGIGIPDYLLVITSGRAISYIVGVELKLRNWRRGLLQAFRYRNFTNEAYVVIDRDHIEPALANRQHFLRAGIGLASFDEGGVFEIHVVASPGKPFSKLLAERITVRVSEALSDFDWDPEMTSYEFVRTNSRRRSLIGFREYLAKDALSTFEAIKV
jgi:hypothetical protein